MNINDTSTQLLFTTVPIVGITTEGTGVSGTGFFFSYDLEDGRKVPLLITNHHVLKDVIQGRFVINLAEGDAPSCETISVNFDKSFIEGKKLGELDLVAMPVAPVLSMLEENGKRPFYRSHRLWTHPEEECAGQFGGARANHLYRIPQRAL